MPRLRLEAELPSNAAGGADFTLRECCSAAVSLRLKGCLQHGHWSLSSRHDQMHRVWNAC